VWTHTMNDEREKAAKVACQKVKEAAESISLIWE